MTECRICRERYAPAECGISGVCDRCAENTVRTIEFLFGSATIPLPRKWFHVSPHRIETGTVLMPGAIRNPANDAFYRAGFGQDTGCLQEMGVRRDEVVWLSPTTQDAEFWAAVLDAPYCYEVQPSGEPRPWNGTGTDGWVTAKAVVVREVRNQMSELTGARGETLCAVCAEQTIDAGGTWIHTHTGEQHCGTGDGATAFPAFLWVEQEARLKSREEKPSR